MGICLVPCRRFHRERTSVLRESEGRWLTVKLIWIRPFFAKVTQSAQNLRVIWGQRRHRGNKPILRKFRNDFGSPILPDLSTPFSIQFTARYGSPLQSNGGTPRSGSMGSAPTVTRSSTTRRPILLNGRSAKGAFHILDVASQDQIIAYER